MVGVKSRRVRPVSTLVPALLVWRRMSTNSPVAEKYSGVPQSGRSLRVNETRGADPVSVELFASKKYSVRSNVAFTP